MTGPGGPLLEVEGLAATYGGGVRALSGVSLTVGRGEIVALVGANGAGKSTTLKALASLLPIERGAVTDGRVVFDAESVEGLRADALVRRGLVLAPEGRRCFRSLSVEENLVAGALGRGSSRAERREDLEKIYALFPRLAEIRRRQAGLASGGEQQMVAIGRALASRPRLLLLDEPSMGLAPLVVEHIFDALAALSRDQGLSILLAEQNVAAALSRAQRAVVIAAGRSALAGEAAALAKRSDLQDLYLGRAPTIDRRAA